ncbi:phytanoyl-CoA dioxygenase family protein [soil metagenome]
MKDEVLQEDFLLRLAADGCGLLANVIGGLELLALQDHAAKLLADSGKEKTAGLRNLLADDPALIGFARSSPAAKIAATILGYAARPVRIILFDKSEQANWSVPWHQDVNIAVTGKTERDDYGPWTTKEGVQHVVPPVAVLERMITLRLHLDECGTDNGPLRIAPGSHCLGIVRGSAARSQDFEKNAREMLADAGDVIAMRPLVFHSSQKASSAQRRRVLHIEYAAGSLAEGLSWFFTGQS